MEGDSGQNTDRGSGPWTQFRDAKREMCVCVCVCVFVGVAIREEMKSILYPASKQLTRYHAWTESQPTEHHTNCSDAIQRAVRYTQCAFLKGSDDAHCPSLGIADRNHRRNLANNIGREAKSTMGTRNFNFFLIFVAQKVSNIHLVTKDVKIVPLTSLLKLLLAGRVVGGGGSVLLGLY